MVRATLPKEWADELRISKENQGLKLNFDGEKNNDRKSIIKEL